jgi:RimJ/RimL family protein N-acetyltransferase
MSHPNDRVYLELFAQRESVDLLVALMQESAFEEIRDYIARPVVDTEAQISAFGKGSIADGQLHWAVRDINTHFCLGSLQASRTTDGGIVIGYRIRSESQNKGIATEALGILLKELLRSFPNAGILANVHPQNLVSIRVLVKSGFAPLEARNVGQAVNINSERRFRYVRPTNAVA